MAGQAQPIGITTAFPAPPPFYKFFTPENLERQKEYLESLKQSSSDPSAATPILPDLFSLPPELRNLIPPPLPPDGKYRLFGQELEVPTFHPTSFPPSHPTRPLTSLRSPQIYPQPHCQHPHHRACKP